MHHENGRLTFFPQSDLKYILAIDIVLRTKWRIHAMHCIRNGSLHEHARLP